MQHSLFHSRIDEEVVLPFIIISTYYFVCGQVLTQFGWRKIGLFLLSFAKQCCMNVKLEWKIFLNYIMDFLFIFLCILFNFTMILWYKPINAKEAIVIKQKIWFSPNNSKKYNFFLRIEIHTYLVSENKKYWKFIRSNYEWCIWNGSCGFSFHSIWCQHTLFLKPWNILCDLDYKRNNI